MKNSKKKILYVWASDFSKSRGEGLLGRCFIEDLSRITDKKIYVNGLKYSDIKKKNLFISTSLFHNYLNPFLGVLKIWKQYFLKKETIYLNYLPLWNFLIFLLLPKKTILGPITGGAKFSKINIGNFYVRKYIFPILYSISLMIIKKKYKKAIFSTNLLKKYIGHQKNFIFNYCLNIYEKKVFKSKKEFDVIFYYRLNKNKNNHNSRKLINKLIENNFKVAVIGDNPKIDRLFYLGNIKREKALQYISKSKFSVNNNENMYSLFCLDSLSCGTQVVFFGKKNYEKPFFAKNSIIQIELSKPDEQYLFLSRLFKKKLKKIEKTKNFLVNKKKNI